METTFPDLLIKEIDELPDNVICVVSGGSIVCLDPVTGEMSGDDDGDHE